MAKKNKIFDKIDSFRNSNVKYEFNDEQNEFILECRKGNPVSFDNMAILFKEAWGTNMSPDSLRRQYRRLVY